MTLKVRKTKLKESEEIQSDEKESIMDNTRGAGPLADEVRKAYTEGYDDYHMKPLKPSMVPSNSSIDDGDSVIFCCRRGEREIELTEMFTSCDFNKVPIRKLKNLDFVILTQYHEKFMHLPIAFAPEHVLSPLSQVLSENGKTQFHCSESEKFAHVTFFFNGGENKPFAGETDFCVPSPRGIDFASKPELSIEGVTENVASAIGKYDFIVVNFANGDVIGHTTDTEAKIKACGFVSHYLEMLFKKAMDAGYVVCITADHGNIETLRNLSGKPHVAHTSNKVPFIIADGNHPERRFNLKDGSLKDVAPTILEIMGISKAGLMDGDSLVTEGNFEKNRKTILIILDGWGVGSCDDNDAIHVADTPAWDYLLNNYSVCRLEASGEAVGLCKGKPGNSEAGHVNLGAGRCVLQDDIRIDLAMANGEFANNQVINNAIRKSIQNDKSLHLITFLTYKSSHGSMDYSVEVCRMAKKLGQKKVFLHIIFDGRSTEPDSAPVLLSDLQQKLEKIGIGYIVDGIGRGLVLDRDGNYDNVKKGYDMMTSK